MIAKVIAYGRTREETMARMRNAMEEMHIDGIKTNISLHQRLLKDAEFMKGGTNIHYLEKLLGLK